MQTKGRLAAVRTTPSRISIIVNDVSAPSHSQICPCFVPVLSPIHLEYSLQPFLLLLFLFLLLLILLHLFAPVVTAITACGVRTSPTATLRNKSEEYK